MNRQQAMDLLKTFMPSWEREFKDAEWLGELGWLYQDEFGKSLPLSIPEDYLLGRTFVDGRNRSLTVVDSNHLTDPEIIEFRKKRGVPAGRQVNVEYHNFPGHPHMYAKIRLKHSEWQWVDEKGRECWTNVFDKEIPKDQEELKNVGNLVITPSRILPQSEIDEHPYDWEHYEAGCRTDRFLKVSELYATAFYIALLRVEGPFYVVAEDPVVAYQRKNLAMTVSARGTVRFYNEFKTAFVQK